MSNFPEINKAEWVSKIIEELKPKSIEDISKQIIEGVTNDPFALKEDLPNDYSYSWNSQHHSWKIAFEIQIEQESQANEIALSALEAGTEHLDFITKEQGISFDFNVLLDNIHLDWIQTSFTLSELMEENLKDYLLKKYKQGNPTFIQLLKKDQNYFECDLSSDNKRENIVVFLKEIETVLSNKVSYEQKQIIRFIIGADFLRNIILLRAIKLMICRLCELYAVDVDSFIFEVRVSSFLKNSDPHYQLIHLSHVALSAVMVGIDRLYIPSAAKKDENSLWLKSAIAIQHLFKEESNLHKIKDPVAGSFYIENMVEKCCVSIWNEFRKK